MPASPNTVNYFEGTGILKFTPTGGVERDLGNIVSFEITPAVERRDHFSKRQGTRKKDRSVVTQQSATAVIVMDEITAENLRLLLMSEVVENTDGTNTLRILSISEITGALTFEGTNDIGNKFDGNFPSVSFGPSGSFSPISDGDDWGQLEVTCELLSTEYTDGSTDFGTITETPAS